MRFIPRSRLLQNLVDLLLIFIGFAAAIFPYSGLLESGLTLNEMLTASAISAFTFWAVIQLHDTDSEDFVGAFLERFCLGTGANLLVHAVLTYTFFVRRTPFLIAVGSLFAATLLSLSRRWVSGRDKQESRVLLVGIDAISSRIAGSLGQPLLGAIGWEGSVLPTGIPFLGSIEKCEKILLDYRPTHVVVGTDDWNSHVSPSVLLNCKLAGTVVEDSPSVYQRLFHRISCARLQPMDLVLSSAWRGDSRTMAIQAVYTNLIGLFCLVALAPLLLIVSIAVAVSSGAGPVLEGVDCAGFRYIPFRLLRFRTRRLDGGDGMTAIGHALTRMQLVNLPQLINVVRGEMALVGPRPVRRELADFLTQLMPFYSHRVSVKPGIFGWAQMHVPQTGLPADECLQMEYDLYYIKEGSPWLDGQIMLDTLLRRGAQPVTATEPTGARSGPC